MSRIFINKEKFTQECNKRIEAAKSRLQSLDGKEAVQCGLIDKVGTLHEALCALYKMIDKQRTGKKKSR